MINIHQEPGQELEHVEPTDSLVSFGVLSLSGCLCIHQIPLKE